MNSAPTPVKKSALCRYYANSGTCFYGDDCQFLHEDSRVRKVDGVNPSSNLLDANDAPGENLYIILGNLLLNLVVLSCGIGVCGRCNVSVTLPSANP